MTDSQKLDLILDKVIILDAKIDNLDARVSRLEAKVDSLDARVSRLEAKVDSLDARVSRLETKVDSLDARVSHLEADMQEVKQAVTRIDLTIENEIRVNIKRVAEGHLDLSRNMHEVMKPNNEIEMLSIRVRILESDVKELKQKTS